MRPPRPNNPFRRSQSSVIPKLIVVNVVLFILSSVGSSESNGIYQLLYLSPRTVGHVQLWRLLTYMFLHGDFFHIFFNLWGLFLFGAPVEKRLGSAHFLRLYFISGLVGALAWLLANWGTEYRLIGASGGVFGVMMAAAMAFPTMRISLLFPPITMNLKTLVLFYAFIEVLSALTGGGRIAHLAHLGGLAGAFFYMKRLGHSSPWNFLRNQFSRGLAKRRRQNLHSNSQRPETPPPSPGKNIEAEVDRILDKIGREGINSLTPAERATLEQARERLKKR